MGAPVSGDMMFLRCLLALVLAAPVLASAATILVFGDSLSSAYGLERNRGWATLMQQRLDEKKFNYKIANASISGETTAGGRNRIAGALATHRPVVVIIALGANDGLRGLSLDAMRANLEAMVRSSRKSGAKVLLVGMRLPPNFGPEYAEKFQQVYRDIAARERIPSVPFLLEGFAEKPDFFQPDGIHPAVPAQALVLENVWKGLVPLLKGRER
jgi:acyl-CoA thioesterase-1